MDPLLRTVGFQEAMHADLVLWVHEGFVKQWLSFCFSLSAELTVYVFPTECPLETVHRGCHISPFAISSRIMVWHIPALSEHHVTMQSWSDSGLPSLSIFVVRMAKGLTPDKAVSMSAKYIRAWFLFLTAIYTLSPILRSVHMKSYACALSWEHCIA